MFGLVFLSMSAAIQTIARSMCHSLKSNTFDLIVFYHIKTLVEKVMRYTVSMLLLHFFLHNLFDKSLFDHEIGLRWDFS